ncbi:hypothetical protein K491DRAFT_690235 [Lophiostoma macrostomum CBS 122681]|uniref:Protein BIG1 n=1 Tax=Lophiostoma macrostomum CBS 122681 TaxID=1314788 RepID=A0A6A6TI15_9PLEO|nr:hypothetical protein K491DRAFT_690235 [Lophiostoma macrostomum CBS 122681]
MAKALVGALALASLPSALAFRNTSPFFLFSSADVNVDGQDAQVAQSGQVTADAIASMKSCPSRVYLIVRQGSVSSSDYIDDTNAPTLSSIMTGGLSSVKSAAVIPEVVGSVDADRISSHLQSACSAEVRKIDYADWAESGVESLPLPMTEESAPQVVELTLPVPPAKHRQQYLGAYDAAFHSIFTHVAEAGGYTVIYTTTAQTQAQAEALENERTYEMEDPFGGAVQMELKRDTAVVHRRRATKGQKTGGLFEKYQFLSPGLFMGISATIPLFLILYFGLQSLASLEVSYFAFSKEMGPTAQRKAQ